MSLGTQTTSWTLAVKSPSPVYIKVTTVPDLLLNCQNAQRDWSGFVVSGHRAFEGQADRETERETLGRERERYKVLTDSTFAGFSS